MIESHNGFMWFLRANFNLRCELPCGSSHRKLQEVTKDNFLCFFIIKYKLSIFGCYKYFILMSNFYELVDELWCNRPLWPYSSTILQTFQFKTAVSVCNIKINTLFSTRRYDSNITSVGTFYIALSSQALQNWFIGL